MINLEKLAKEKRREKLNTELQLEAIEARLQKNNQQTISTPSNYSLLQNSTVISNQISPILPTNHTSTPPIPSTNPTTSSIQPTNLTITPQNQIPSDNPFPFYNSNLNPLPNAINLVKESEEFDIGDVISFKFPPHLMTIDFGKITGFLPENVLLVKCAKKKLKKSKFIRCSFGDEESISIASSSILCSFQLNADGQVSMKVENVLKKNGFIFPQIN